MSRCRHRPERSRVVEGDCLFALKPRRRGPPMRRVGQDLSGGDPLGSHLRRAASPQQTFETHLAYRDRRIIEQVQRWLLRQTERNLRAILVAEYCSEGVMVPV